MTASDDDDDIALRSHTLRQPRALTE